MEIIIYKKKNNDKKYIIWLDIFTKFLQAIEINETILFLKLHKICLC